jgi:hypothetical protein
MNVKDVIIIYFKNLRVFLQIGMIGGIGLLGRVTHRTHQLTAREPLSRSFWFSVRLKRFSWLFEAQKLRAHS